MKKKLCSIIIVIIVIIVLVMLRKSLSSNNKLSDIIMEYVDNNADKNNNSILSMKNITDFKWDKMLIFMEGSTNSEISEILGVEFNDCIDLSWGMIFMYKNKIIYKESIFRDPDHSEHKLLYLNCGQPKFIEYTPDDCIFEVNKKIISDNYYYYIIAPTNIN